MCKEFRASSPNLRRLACLHGSFNLFCKLREQPSVLWKVERLDAVALLETGSVFASGWCLGKHDERLCANYRSDDSASVARWILEILHPTGKGLYRIREPRGLSDGVILSQTFQRRFHGIDSW